ncbi:MAG: hypothetical protein KatS3mg110_3497 [Pirellulaceae bacterium]|nr:MAG: hypothetical protein KatS3mg110_3497 [Pirellulaceae bacterium]
MAEPVRRDEGEETRRLKELEQENGGLKKLLAEAELDKAILRKALKGNGRSLGGRARVRRKTSVVGWFLFVAEVARRLRQQPP